MQSATGLPRETTGNIPVADVPREEATVSTAPVEPVPLSKKTPALAALPLHYEFIGSDLKRIGVLTVIVVILLIVAYLIFS